MNVSATAPVPAPIGAAPESLPELAFAQARYQRVFGWPVSLDVEQRRLFVPVGEAFDAVTMPASLAETVRNELRIMMLAGPVIAVPGGQWWTLLTAPATAPRLDLQAALHRLRVHPTPSGAHTIIPTHLNGPCSTWRWVQQPQQHHPLPPWSLVISATRRVAATS